MFSDRCYIKIFSRQTSLLFTFHSNSTYWHSSSKCRLEVGVCEAQKIITNCIFQTRVNLPKLYLIIATNYVCTRRMLQRRFFFSFSILQWFLFKLGIPSWCPCNRQIYMSIEMAYPEKRDRGALFEYHFNLFIQMFLYIRYHCKLILPVLLPSKPIPPESWSGHQCLN